MSERGYRPKLTPELEELARLIGELASGRRYSQSEMVAFKAGLPQSTERRVNVTNAAAVKLAGDDPQRQQLIILNNSASPIEVGARDVQFGSGLPIASGAERGLGDFPGEVWAIANVAGPLDVRVRSEA